jgi:hypothetical protein
MQLPSPLGQAPGLPQPFVTSAFATLSSSASKTIPANVTNSDNTTIQAAGFNVPVTAGSPFTTQFLVFWDTGANLNGLTLALIHPGLTATVDIRVNTTGLVTQTQQVASVTASPMTIGSGIPGAYAGRVFALIHVSGTPTVTGVIDIGFRPVTNTNLMTLLAGSVARS